MTTPTYKNDLRGASLRLRGVKKIYGNNVVADDVSIEISPSEFVTLLGASGSGKTTLLRIIAGFLDPTAGSIEFDDVDITTVPVHKRRIGMVFQNYALFPHMDVLHNVMFPLEMHKVPRADRKNLAREALAAVKLEGFESRKPSQLSGGQQQRVALARAIVMKPRLLLMDEPLGALDRRLREAMQIEILKLSRELGLTVINVTHDQEEAFTMSDKIALLSDGKLVQYGAPEELYLHPVNDTTAEFLGESNLFRGKLSRSSTSWVVDDGHVNIEVTDIQASRFAEGSQVVAVVRPWSVSVRSRDHSNPGGVQGAVSAVIYAGESQKVLVTDERNKEYIVRRTLEDELPVEVGDRVSLRWSPEHVVVTAPMVRN
ncbi:ABC transporter ATP-binding protein [Microbacterium maritypicum]|uniref:ABC transporter ATP-binding protein n=1 Tax=Microbacterium maritypicum TaxID=33918 RepID=UPI001B323AA8|nr:ABC transporter ATP-binding protein [Microbacterium liquefaciens]MBP5801300.1 ABC transporter ATP-binding protein [Microbacterium liquefaciens]